MTEWATWQTELPPLFGSLLGVPCDWADQARALHQGARAQLTIIATPAMGVEDVSYDRDDVAGTQIEERSGDRVMVLQVAVWNPRQVLDQSARAVLERLRGRLGFDSTLERLRTLGLSYQSVGDPVALDQVRDNRRTSMWTMDVRLGFRWTESDTDTPTSWIEHGRITAQSATDVDDAPLHAGLQSDINPSPPPDP
ncbi:MAG: hypothetical protein SangKO_075670 [Sandaracinaceae bacterium]